MKKRDVDPALSAKARAGRLKCEDAWQEWEVQALRDHYPDGGWPAVMTATCGRRSKLSIRAKAMAMGIRCSQAGALAAQRYAFETMGRAVKPQAGADAPLKPPAGGPIGSRHAKYIRNKNTPAPYYGPRVPSIFHLGAALAAD